MEFNTPAATSTVSSAPTVVLSPLHRADGSATYSSAGYSVTTSINGPLEVQRRDEIPEETFIEVLVRPAAGVGSSKEREIEGKIATLLKSAILERKYPRSLIQVTCQVDQLPEDSVESMRPTASNSLLPLLPHLLNSVLLALLSSSLALRSTFLSILVASTSSGPITDPSPAQISRASAVHIFTFTLTGACLLSESEGVFNFVDYETAYESAKTTVLATGEQKGSTSLETWLRRVVGDKGRREQRWRDD